MGGSVMRSKITTLQALKLPLIAFAIIGFVSFSSEKSKAITMDTVTGAGNLTLNIDMNLSAGVSVRLKDVSPDDIASQSGGNDQVRGLPTCTAAPAPGCLARFAGGSVGFSDSSDKNFAGNANNDDGRLNFQEIGDITGATFKALVEVQASLASGAGDFTFFTRLNGFYDPVLQASFNLNDVGDVYDRGAPGDAGRRELGRDLQVLDLALSWDYDIPAGDSIGTIPFSLKFGKLAANNWGEATFSFTGIAQGIVLDVPAARRPGAQIKEIIGTEYMVYASVGLPFDIGLDAYYQFFHTPWKLSPSDSPFAVSDTPNPSNRAGNHLQLSGSAASGTFRRNCAGGTFIAGVIGPQCDTDSIIHYSNTYYDTLPNERAENVRLANGDLLTARVDYVDADNQGQYGVQISYYFPFLNGIEFNLSYQNVHSRLPYARMKTDGVPVVTLTTISGASAASTNSLNGLGCTGVNPALPNSGGFLATGLFLDPSLQPSTSGTASGDGEYIPIAGPVAGLIAALSGGSSDIDNLSTQNGRRTIQDKNSLKVAVDTRHFGGNPKGGSGYRDRAVFHDSDPLQYNYLTQNDNSALVRLAQAADAALAAGTATPTPTGVPTIEANLKAEGVTRYDVARINCAIYKGTAVTTGLRAGLAAASPALANLSPIGTEYLTLQYNTRMDLYYPENLTIIGLGFNTTIPWLEWGLQAEISYRPDTPLQQDVTEQIVAHASAQGTGLALGDTAGIALAPLVTTGGDGDAGLSVADTDWTYSTGAAVNGAGAVGIATAAGATGAALQAAFVAGYNGRDAHSFAASFNPNTMECFLDGECGSEGIVEADMLNVTVGITALYNASNIIVGLLGGDQAIFLAEVNVIHFLDEIPEGWDGATGITRGGKANTLACLRYSGTELPLGGLVGLDTVTDFSCSPDQTSLGYTLLGFIDYNNVFGTAWRIRPIVSIRHAPYGNTPSPIPGWREDTLSVNAGVSFAFQNTWNVSLGYVGYFDVGDEFYNVNRGLDTFSFDISYAF